MRKTLVFWKIEKNQVIYSCVINKSLCLRIVRDPRSIFKKKFIENAFKMAEIRSK